LIRITNSDSDICARAGAATQARREHRGHKDAGLKSSHDGSPLNRRYSRMTILRIVILL